MPTKDPARPARAPSLFNAIQNRVAAQQAAQQAPPTVNTGLVESCRRAAADPAWLAQQDRQTRAAVIRYRNSAVGRRTLAEPATDDQTADTTGDEQ